MTDLQKQIIDEQAKLLALHAESVNRLVSQQKYVAARDVLKKIELAMMDLPSRLALAAKEQRYEARYVRFGWVVIDTHNGNITAESLAGKGWMEEREAKTMADKMNKEQK